MPVSSLGKRFRTWALRSSNKFAVVDLMNHAERIDAACSSLDGAQRAALDTGPTRTPVSKGKQKATTFQAPAV